MNRSHILGVPPGAGTGGSGKVAGQTRNHAGMLLCLLLLAPLAANGAAPDRDYVDRLAHHLSTKLPGLTPDRIDLSIQPNCLAEQVELRAVHENVFGTSTITLRCAGSNSFPFTAMAHIKLPGSQATGVTASTVRKGSTVRLEIALQGMSIFATAHALASGAAGDTIPVRTTRTNRILRAQVIDSSNVRAILGDTRK